MVPLKKPEVEAAHSHNIKIETKKTPGAPEWGARCFYLFLYKIIDFREYFGIVMHDIRKGSSLDVSHPCEGISVDIAGLLGSKLLHLGNTASKI